MKKQINININYNVHSVEELQGVIDALHTKGMKITLNVDDNLNKPAVSGTESVNNSAVDEEVRKVLLANGYVDLGLPSGTLWKASLDDQYIDYETASKAYELPTKAQFDELLTYTKVYMLDMSVKFQAVNKQYITIKKWGYKTNGTTINKTQGLYLFFKKTTNSDDNVLLIEHQRGKTADARMLKADEHEMCSVLLCSKPLKQ